MNKPATFYTVLLVACVLFGAGANCKREDGRLKDFKLGMAFTQKGEIKLTDQSNRPFSYKKYLGRPALLFFGFTHCPDICPGTLANIARARKLMKAKPDQLPVIFVTVDPARDTPAKIAEYLKKFSIPAAGLTGSEAELEKMAKAFGASFDKRMLDDKGAYTMDHTAYVYLLDAKGRVRYFFKFKDPPEMIADIAGSLL